MNEHSRKYSTTELEQCPVPIKIVTEIRNRLTALWCMCVCRHPKDIQGPSALVGSGSVPLLVCSMWNGESISLSTDAVAGECGQL